MRLIDADALIEFIVEEAQDLRTLSTKTVGQAISKTPTVDAVSVIRCKDCQYWMKNPYRESSVFGLCFKHKDIAIALYETDYCSRAERRNDETD